MWFNLKKIKNFTFFRFHSFIFFIYPLLASVGALSGNSINFIVLNFGPPVDIGINFPFSINILYVASVLIFSGNILFYARCPDIVKRYDSYEEYKAEGMSKDFLLLITRNETLENELKTKVERIKVSDTYDEGILKNVFTQLYIFSSNIRKISSSTILLLFFAGVSCVLFVIIENVFYSFKFMTGL